MSLESQLSKKRRIKLLRKRCPHPLGTKLKRTLRVAIISEEEVKDEQLKEDDYALDTDKLLLYNFKEYAQPPQMPLQTVNLSTASDIGLAT